MKVAVYGTLRQGCRNNVLLSSSDFLGKTLTKEEYTLRTMGGCPAVDKTLATSPIVVEVYEVSQEVLSRLDRLEGYSSKDDYWYNRSPVDTVDFGEAMMYHIDNSRNPIIPSGDWLVGRQGASV